MSVSPAFVVLRRNTRAALAAWDREVAISEGKAVPAPVPAQDRYEWKEIGGCLHEWKLLDNESGIYVAGIWSHSGVWHYESKQYVSQRQKRALSDRREHHHVPVPLRLYPVRPRAPYGPARLRQAFAAGHTERNTLFERNLQLFQNLSHGDGTVQR